MSLNLADEKVVKALGIPFNFCARYSNASITPKDIDYLQNTIRKHPCFPLIDKAYYIKGLPYQPLEVAYAKINQIVFYSKFYNDPQCPPGIKLILFTHLGLTQGELEEDNELDLLYFRYPYVEQWINSVKQKSSP